MELVKENILYEQLLSEKFADTVLRDEYVIPDIHPDIREVLLLDAKPKITNLEVLQDKVYLDGEVQYNLLYLSRNNDVTELHSVNYSTKFNNSVECNGVSHEMQCDAECFVEHMDCIIVNERKVCIEGIVKVKTEVYNKYDYEIVKDVREADDVQFFRNPIKVDKIVENISTDLLAESHIKIPMEKPQVDKVVKCDVNLHKKEVKLFEGKLKIELYACIKLLYKSGNNDRELYWVEDDVLVEKEVTVEKAEERMENYTDYQILDTNYSIKEDDLGESRIVDITVMARANTKIMAKDEIEMIEDAYSPSMVLDMEKKEYKMNVMHSQELSEKIIKGDIEIDSNMPAPREIIMCKAALCVTDKKVVEDRVVVEGVMNVDAIYRSADEDKYICSIQDQIPFSCAVDMPGTKIHMQCVCKVFLDNVEADIQAGNIAVKAVAKVYVRVNYIQNKEFLVDLSPGQGELPKKKASVIIYVVQPGDTLWKIAKKYTTTIDNLVKVNDIADPDNIKVGQKLIIPGRSVM